MTTNYLHNDIAERLPNELKNCPQCDTRDGLLRKVNKVFVNKTETGSNIKNVGDDEMLVLLWANEIFDRHLPDTIASIM